MDLSKTCNIERKLAPIIKTKWTVSMVYFRDNGIAVACNKVIMKLFAKAQGQRSQRV